MIAKLALAFAMTIASVASSGLTYAHGPQAHRAALVEFNRPLPAPDFALPGLDGATIRLADYRGKLVLLNFWATWCPPCVKEMPSLQRLAETLRDVPFVVLAVSQDAEGEPKVKPFLQRVGVTFLVALDRDSKVSDAYGANDLPSTFLIDAQGRVVAAAKGERDWAAPNMVEYLREVIARRS